MIEKYKTYRRIGMMLNQKMMKAYLDRDILFKAAGLLGMVSGNTLIFESEDETSVLMDFALYECVFGNKSVTSTYREKVGGENEQEKDILTALISSYTLRGRQTTALTARSLLFWNGRVESGPFSAIPRKESCRLFPADRSNSFAVPEHQGNAHPAKRQGIVELSKSTHIDKSF
ncbi:MAG: hypothetical protein AB1652_07135 [Bacillota bacterium]